MTIQEFEQQLFLFDPVETALRSYYERHGTFMPSARIAALSDCQHLTLPPADLHNILHTPTEPVPIHTGDLSAASLKEINHFLPDYDIFISRHARYCFSPWHDHQFFELSYQYSGTCRQDFSLPDHSEQSLDLSAGDLLLTPPGQLHQVTPREDGLLINIGIRATTFRRAFLHAIPKDSVLGSFFSNQLLTGQNALAYLRFSTARDSRIHEQICQLMLSYLEDRPYIQEELNLLLSLILLRLLQNTANQCETCPLQHGHRQIVQILQYLDANYRHTSVAETAAHFGYSPDYLTSIFRQNTGQTIQDVLQEKKMSYASELLRSTRLPISAIAAELGYKDTTNLIRSFRKTYGTTPGTYRRQHS